MTAQFGFHVATPPGAAGIAIFELYGDAESFFRAHVRVEGELPAPGRARLARIVDELNETIDDAVVTRVPASDSWSRMPCSRLSTHGGPWIVERVRVLLAAAGGEPRSRAEILSLAVSAGGLDAIEAEAYEALVGARTSAAVRFLLRQCSGELSRRLRALIGRLDIDGARGIGEIGERLDEILASAEAARRLVDPGRVLIAGPPNSGKSTLFNALCGRRRALVSPRAGTTRDFNTAEIELEGFPIELTDSAGVHGSPDDPVEAEAIRRVALRAADLVVLLVPPPWTVPAGSWARVATELRVPPPSIRGETPESFPEPLGESGLIVAASFADLDGPRSARFDISISPLRGDGIPELRSRIVRALTGRAGPRPADDLLAAPFLVRQVDLLAHARAACRAANSASLDEIREPLIMCLRSFRHRVAAHRVGSAGP
jgi:hypothetical protein